MNKQDKHPVDCSEVLDLLLSQMENENFDQTQFNQLVQNHPSCAEALTANYTLWNDLVTLPTPEPSAEMSSNFYKKLNEYSTQTKVVPSHPIGLWNWLKKWTIPNNASISWALGIGLFLFGFFSGQFLGPNQQQAQINELIAQVNQLQKNQQAENNLSDTRFQINLQQSVSNRMKDIQLVRQMDNPNAKILMALNKAICNDPNINVRLSAIESLVYFSDDPKVMEILIKAIPKQTSPIVQLELAEVMVQLEEKRSSGAWKELLESGDLELNVKMQLEESLQVLL